MRDLIKSFVYDRNTYKKTAELSADTVAAHISLVEQGVPLFKAQSNRIGALASFMGLFKRDANGYRLTRLAIEYSKLYSQNKIDSFRWLITRSLWRFVVPNGTNTGSNVPAKSLGISFNFFSTFIGALQHLQAESDNERFLYYDELCRLLSVDANWSRSSYEWYEEILRLRHSNTLNRDRGLLEDLESEYGVPRDNLNGLFNSAFQSTGLFQFKRANGKIVGISLASPLDEVLQKRIRFILDHPVSWDDSKESWSDFLNLQTEELPLEVSPVAEFHEIDDADLPIDTIIPAALEHFKQSNFHINEDLLRRFVSSLLAKRFVILTGLAGSGKTKLAQAFAAWITPKSTRLDCFYRGAEIKSTSAIYFVKDSDHLSVELSTSLDQGTGTKVTLPRALIQEWVDVILENNFTRDTPPRTIREIVAQTTSYSTQLNSFESQLKAAAFAVVESQAEEHESHYEIVPVGADWTGSENIIGYPDALNPQRYVRTQALELILRARANPRRPFFLILDEMNLSHVERYFADLLSAIESDSHIRLHGDNEQTVEQTRDGVPMSIHVPPNLYVVGTVNVDETTYMFSPKVLDRANVLEFRLSSRELKTFLASPRGMDLSGLRGTGVRFAHSFVEAAIDKDIRVSALIRDLYENEMLSFFNLLQMHNSEFGYRTSYEAERFVYFYRLVGGFSDDDKSGLNSAIDAVIVQKLLPKLHGSRSKLEGLLWALAWACGMEARNREGKDFVSQIKEASLALDEAKYGPEVVWSRLESINPDDPATVARYPLSFEKIMRMWRKLVRDQFVTFAEA